MVSCLHLVLVSTDNLGTTRLMMKCDLDWWQNYGEQRSPGLPVAGTVLHKQNCTSLSSCMSWVTSLEVKGLSLKCVFCSNRHHTLVMTERRKLYSFGCNTHGQLGRGLESHPSVPLPVLLPQGHWQVLVFKGNSTAKTLTVLKENEKGWLSLLNNIISCFLRGLQWSCGEKHLFRRKLLLCDMFVHEGNKSRHRLWHVHDKFQMWVRVEFNPSFFFFHVSAESEERGKR